MGGLVATPAKPASAQDLHPDDLRDLETQYIRVLAGMGDTARALKVIESELGRLAEQPANVTPIARQTLERARTEYRKTLQKASQLATSLGVPIPFEMLANAAETSGDVGAVTRETFRDSPRGADAAFRTMTSDIMSGGIAPSASVVTAGRALAAKAVAKLGAAKAVGAAGSFARFGAANGKRAAALVVKAGGKFMTPAMQTAVTGAVAWFAAAAAIRLAAPGIGSGLGNLFSSPGGLLLGGLALYLFLGRKGR